MGKKYVLFSSSTLNFRNPQVISQSVGYLIKDFLFHYPVVIKVV